MAYFDLPLEQLQTYSPAMEVPEDFDDFWRETLAEARSLPLNLQVIRVESGLRLVDTFDVQFAGFGGTPVHCWLSMPHGQVEPLTAVVELLGYGGGRGLPHTRTLFAQAGYAHLTMDTRGQGGDTHDADQWSGDYHGGGQLARGLDDPRHHYYRRLYVDAVRAVEAAAALPFTRDVVVSGKSQGGGLAIAAAALSAVPQAALVDVPFLCNFPRAIAVTDAQPYRQLTDYFARFPDRVARGLRTLSYLDGANLASRARVPALFSVGLMDNVCPPSTVFSAINAWGGQADVRVYPHDGHDGGGAHHELERLRWLAAWARGTVPSRQ